MDVFEAIRTRRSVREYQGGAVPEEKLRKVLEAARLAPSAHNAQERQFIVVKDEAKRKALAEAADQPFIAQAPIVIAAVGLAPQRVLPCSVPNYAVDLAIAVDHMTLAAVEQGLGTCWIGAFSQEEAKKILGVPENCKIVALLPLGFPADSAGTKSRKPLKEIVSYDSF